jgi:glycosyltransferase involved in cell wall biosynthesis
MGEVDEQNRLCGAVRSVYSGGNREVNTAPMGTRVGITMTSSMVQRYTMGPFDHTVIVRSRDLVAMIRGVKRKIVGTDSIKATDFTNTIHGLNLVGHADLLHLFNTLSIGRQPYVVTYEQYLPRWNPHSRFGLRQMMRPHCRKLIAMSQFAHRYQLALLSEDGVPARSLVEKMAILHPGQRLLLDSYDQKPLTEGTIRCLFVGRDFFRKGGREVLMVFQQLIAEGLPLHLTVVSSLGAGDYASQATTDDQAWAKRQLMEGGQSGILYHAELPNPEVLRLMVQSHLTLLPTYDDTYGFSVLEAQAAGSPVITTDVCAMPEINNPSVGWMLEVEKDDLGVAVRRTAAERGRLSESIRGQLEATLRALCSSPHQIREKGIRALERVGRMHHPPTVARAVEALYDEGLSLPLTRTATPQPTSTSGDEPSSRRVASISDR